MTYEAIARRLRKPLWIGWAVGGVVWVVWLGSLAYGGWKRDAVNQLFAADHIAFYTAAKLIRVGRQAEIYDFDAVGREQQEIVGGDWPFLMGYRNPPFYALLYVPTAGLPLPLSALVWVGVGFLAFAFVVWCLKHERPWRTAAWAFTLYPFFAAVSFGQNTLLSMAVFAAVYRLLAAQRVFAAGLAAGLLWYKPQLLVGLFLWWGLTPRRHGRAWAGVAATGTVLAAVCWLALPEASWAFTNSLRAIVAYGGEEPGIKYGTRGFWSILLPAEVAGLAWPLTLACSLAAIGVAAWVARRTGAPLAVMFPVAMFLTLWCSPHALVYEWALLVPAAIVLWEKFPDRRDAWLVLFAAAWAALAISMTFTKFQVQVLGLPVAVQVCVPVMGAVGWLAARELARTGAAAPQPPVASG